MPIVVSSQGWVKVPPPTPRKRVKVDPAEAFRGPLAYFSCQPLNSKSSSKALVKHSFPYDLHKSPQQLQRQAEQRTVSAPLPPRSIRTERWTEKVEVFEEDSESYSEESDRYSEYTRSTRTPSPPPALPIQNTRRSAPSYHRVRREPDYHHGPVSHYAPSHGSTDSHDYHRHRNRRDREYMPDYDRRSYTDYSAPVRALPPPPPPPPAPMPHSRTRSSRWYSATQPLDLR